VATQPAMVLKPGLIGAMRRSQGSYLKLTVAPLPGKRDARQDSIANVSPLKAF